MKWEIKYLSIFDEYVVVSFTKSRLVSEATLHSFHPNKKVANKTIAALAA